MVAFKKRGWAVLVTSASLIVAGVVAANVFPDQVYGCWQAAAEWAQILTTPSNYSSLPRRDAVPQISIGDLIGPPFEVRKTGSPRRTYTDPEGYSALAAWLVYEHLQDAKIDPDSVETAEPIVQCFSRDLRRQYADALASFMINYGENWRFDLRQLRGKLPIAWREPRRLRSSVAFSSVGFNRGRTVAIFYATYWCGPLCGRGTYYILEKHNGEWGRVEEVARCGWIS